MIDLMPQHDNGLAWSPPSIEQCDQDRMTIALDPEFCLAVRRVLWNGQLVGFAIILSQTTDGEPLEIVCIDTMHHGCVHRHDGSHDVPYKEIRIINSQQDVQESFTDAYDEVYNEYLRRVGMDELR